MKKIILIFLFYLILSCSIINNKHVGFWIVEENDSIVFLEIYEKNSYYYIDVSVHVGDVEKNNLYNDMSKINGMLTKNSNQFIFTDGLNVYPLVITKNDDKLYFLGKVFSRVKKDILINKIEQFNRCKELESSYKKERDEIGYGWVTLIKPKYEKMQNKIQNCNFIN